MGFSEPCPGELECIRNQALQEPARATEGATDKQPPARIFQGRSGGLFLMLIKRVAQIVKCLPAMQKTWGSIPGLGKSPEEGNGNPLQYSCLEKSHGQQSLVGYSPWGRKELDTTERLHIHTSLKVEIPKWLSDTCFLANYVSANGPHVVFYFPRLALRLY